MTKLRRFYKKMTKMLKEDEKKDPFLFGYT